MQISPTRVELIFIWVLFIQTSYSLKLNLILMYFAELKASLNNFKPDWNNDIILVKLPVLVFLDVLIPICLYEPEFLDISVPKQI